ncbi:MAG: hypothetical protein AABX08_00415 [Nanoarchaeota archaeon]
MTAKIYWKKVAKHPENEQKIQKKFGLTRDKIYNIVIIKSYNYLYNEEVYLIAHVGRFTKK